MIKKSLIPASLISFLAMHAHSALPIYPGEIVGRDLNIFGAGWAGHVGITTAPFLDQDAYQVIEVLKDADPIIQINLISTFKTITPYWGSRYGISDRGSNTLRILREANFQKDLGCATYTIWADYMPSTGGYNGTKPRPTYCGRFRCDTFVNYTFNWGFYTLPTYNPPGDITKPTIPKYVFNAFPKGNEDGPYSIGINANSTPVISSNAGLSINSIDAIQLNAISPEEFAELVDIPSNNITQEGINNFFKLITDNTVDPTKRTFLMDKFGFIATTDMVPNLVNLYFKLNNNDELPIKKQLISSLQNIYQRYLMLEQYPNEKTLLINFYLKIINDDLSPVEKAIVIRSFISLASTQETLSNLNKVIDKLDNQKNKLAPQTTLKLKMELLNKSSKIEKIILSNIINQLENENNSELDQIFNEFIVYRLSKQGPGDLLQSSREQIQNYLNATKFKYNRDNLNADNGMTLFSAGAWLEATALINSNSFKDAGKYVSNYLKEKNITEKKRFIIGLSNTKYMQKAFESEPELQAFKQNNNILYLNSVGLPAK